MTHGHAPWSDDTCREGEFSQKVVELGYSGVLSGAEMLK